MSAMQASVAPESIDAGPVSGVRHLSIVPRPARRSTLPPPVRAARMLKTVRQIATRMARRLPSHVVLDDLVGAGALGLADAFVRRNGMPGDEFEAFASYRIRGAILDELRRLDAMPRRTRRMAKDVARATRKVEQTAGGPAEDEAVAAELGMDMPSFQTLRGQLQMRSAPLSLASLTGEEESEAEIADTKAETPDALVAKRQIGESLRDGIQSLPDRHRRVLLGLYSEGETLKEIGVQLGVSESRVCQLHREAMETLRSRVRDSQPPLASGVYARARTPERGDRERASAA